MTSPEELARIREDVLDRLFQTAVMESRLNPAQGHRLTAAHATNFLRQKGGMSPTDRKRIRENAQGDKK